MTTRIKEYFNNCDSDQTLLLNRLMGVYVTSCMLRKRIHYFEKVLHLLGQLHMNQYAHEILLMLEIHKQH